MAHIRKSASKLLKKRCRNQKNNILSCRAKSRMERFGKPRHRREGRKAERMGSEVNQISDMKFSLSVVVVLLCVATLRAEKISLVGATVINPGDGKVLPNATV